MSSISSTRRLDDARADSAARSYARSGWLLCGGVLLLAVFTLRWFLWRHHSFPGDPWAARVGESHKSWLVWKITRAYQQVGRPIPAVGETVVMLAWLWRTSGGRTARGLLVALMASLTCGLIKTLCGPTPVWLGLHHVGSNFPSGVVTFVTAAGGYLVVVSWRQGRRITPAVLLVLIAGSGPARIIGGQHLVSDALGGYMLGAAWLIAAVVFLTRPGASVPQPPVAIEAHAEASEAHELVLSTV